ncbi:MAG: hypothetical protein ABI604_15610 [Nitrospirota bacterium]
MTSDIEFRPFENSWVVVPQERQHLVSMKSIAIMPFSGDPVMADRWAAVFREITDLRVVSPSDVTQSGVPDQGQIGPVRRMSTESQVDCVLIGNVASQAPQKSFAGLKERSSHRLYLQLMSDSGTIMWKTELPFTIVTGAKELDEDMVTKALLAHVSAYADELGFAGRGIFNQQTVSQSLHDASDQQMARPVTGVERP